MVAGAMHMCANDFRSHSNGRLAYPVGPEDVLVLRCGPWKCPQSLVYELGERGHFQISGRASADSWFYERVWPGIISRTEHSDLPDTRSPTVEVWLVVGDGQQLCSNPGSAGDPLPP